MYYCHYIDGAGVHHSNLYHSFNAYYSDTFSPETEIVSFLKFAPFGRSYQERKETVREIAINFQSCAAPGLSYGELADIGNWFETMGRRYGLLNEFRANCIC